MAGEGCLQRPDWGLFLVMPGGVVVGGCQQRPGLFLVMLGGVVVGECRQQPDLGLFLVMLDGVVEGGCRQRPDLKLMLREVEGGCPMVALAVKVQALTEGVAFYLSPGVLATGI